MTAEPKLAPNVLGDRLYVGYRDNGAGEVRLPGWVANNLESLSDANYLGYESVAPADVEQLRPGQHKPENKEFGVRFPVQKGTQVIGPGGMVLMACHKASVEARKAEEHECAKRQRAPKALADIPKKAFFREEEEEGVIETFS